MKEIANISIVIPMLNEEKYVASCIDSILSSDYPKENIEILLMDGMSSDKTRAIIKSYQKKYNFIKLHDNEKKITPIAMNLGIKASIGDYIFIISAHAKYGKDYFSKLVNYAVELDADCVGGVLKTEVKNRSKKANSIKEVLAHRLGVGNADFRIGIDEVKEVDTVAFGCYKKSVFEKYGYYNEQLIRNQDIEINKRIINGRGKIYLVPDVESVYYARENFTDLAKNNFGNGKWNILTSYHTKSLGSLSLRHFIPLLFILSLLNPLLLSFWYPDMILVNLLSLACYLALVIAISIKLKKKENSFFYLIGSFLTLHLSYGLGSLAGIFSAVGKYLKKTNE